MEKKEKDNKIEELNMDDLSAYALFPFVSSIIWGLVDQSDLEFTEKVKRAFFTAVYCEAIFLPYNFIKNEEIAYFNLDNIEKSFYETHGKETFSNISLCLFEKNKKIEQIIELKTHYKRISLDIRKKESLDILLKFSVGRTKRFDLNFGLGSSNNLKKLMFSYNINFIKKPFTTGIEYKVDFKYGKTRPESHHIESKFGMISKKTTYGIGVNFIKEKKVETTPYIYLGYNF